MKLASRLVAIAIATLIAGSAPALAQTPPPPPPNTSYGPDELVAAGHRFFGTVSRDLAGVI